MQSPIKPGKVTRLRQARTGPALFQLADRFAFLTIRALEDRYRHPGAIIFALVEPIGIITILTFTDYILGSLPPFGDSILLFHSAGVIPFYLFFHTAIRLRSLDQAKLFPGQGKAEELAARVFSEFLIKVTLMIAIATVLLLIGSNEWFPRDPLICLEAFAAISLLSCAVGCINAVLISFWPLWWYVFLLLARCGLFVSAVTTVMDRVPLPIREATLYNPFAHIITWFRYGWYVGYPVGSLDLRYSFVTLVVTAIIAVLFEKGTRPSRSIR